MFWNLDSFFDQILLLDADALLLIDPSSDAIFAKARASNTLLIAGTDGARRIRKFVHMRLHCQRLEYPPDVASTEPNCRPGVATKGGSRGLHSVHQHRAGCPGELFL